MENNNSKTSSSIKKFNVAPLLTSIGLTILLLIGNGAILFSDIQKTPLSQFLNYLWLAVILFFWIRWHYPEKQFQIVRKLFSKLDLRQFLIGFGSGLGLFIIGAIGYIISQSAGLHQPEMINNFFTSNRTISALIYLLTTTIFAPIIEEIAFRGIIIRELQSEFSTWGICIISALLFSTYHLSMFQLASTFLIGIALGLLAIKNKNLWIPIIAHGVYNLIGFLLFMFTK